jgi:hypothetical protein
MFIWNLFKEWIRLKLSVNPNIYIWDNYYTLQYCSRSHIESCMIYFRNLTTVIVREDFPLESQHWVSRHSLSVWLIAITDFTVTIAIQSTEPIVTAQDLDINRTPHVFAISLYTWGSKSEQPLSLMQTDSSSSNHYRSNRTRNVVIYVIFIN